ncbi:hypothetical protein ABID42_001737 [Arcicella rosea]
MMILIIGDAQPDAPLLPAGLLGTVKLELVK